MFIVYFVVVLLATTIGALTGMGGGVFIKPLLDVIGDYDAPTVSMLSCITVFAMAVVSVSKTLISNKRQGAKHKVGTDPSTEFNYKTTSAPNSEFVHNSVSTPNTEFAYNLISTSDIEFVHYSNSAVNNGFAYRFNVKSALFLAFGAVLGGNLGHMIFELLVKNTLSNNGVVIVQNLVLAFIILLIFVYMLTKSHIKGFYFKGLFLTLLAGLFLGGLSAFLGIGGGPVNVAFLMLFFSFNTKNATLYSLIIILFAQVSQIITVALNGGFAPFDLSMSPYMVAAAVLGGFLGSILNKKLSNKQIDLCFTLAQIFIFVLCVVNIVKHWI